MKPYYLIWLSGMIIFLLFPISCNHFSGGKDDLTMVEVDLTIENQGGPASSSLAKMQGGHEPVLSSSVKTVLIIAVFESSNSSDIAIDMDNYDRQLMTISSGKVSLLVPLNTSIRLVQLAFESTYTLAQLLSQKPGDSYRGISSAFTLTAADDSKTVSITLGWGPAGWVGTQQIGGSGKDDVHGMAIDSNNTIYLTGHAPAAIEGVSVTGTEDLLVLTYNSAGERQSLRFYTATAGAGQEAYGTDIAVDSNGNQYVTGHIEGNDFYGTDINGLGLRHFLLKIDSSGTASWTKDLGVCQMNENQRVAVDSSGFASTVYAESGINRFASGGTASGSDSTLIAGAALADSATGVATDSSGNMYVAFWDSDVSTRYVIKYNTSAVEQDSQSQQYVWPGDIAVDNSGNVIVVGYIDSANLPLNGETCTGGSWELYVQKFAPSDLSTPTWTRLLCTSGSDEATDVKTDSDGSIFVLGVTNGAFPDETAAGDDAVVAKYDSSGTLQWLDQYGTSGNEQPDALELDSYGYIYISGYSDGEFPGYSTQGLYDIFLLKYTPAGVLMP